MFEDTVTYALSAQSGKNPAVSAVNFKLVATFQLAIAYKKRWHKLWHVYKNKNHQLKPHFSVFELKIDGEWSPIIYKSNIFYLYIVELVKQQQMVKWALSQCSR